MPTKRRAVVQAGETFLFLLLMLVVVLATAATVSNLWIAMSDRGF